MDRISELEKQLEQEREKVKGLEDKLDLFLSAEHIMTVSWKGKVADRDKQLADLQTVLSQLQALVRALPVVRIDLNGACHDTLLAQPEDDAVKELLRYRATLDATTPAPRQRQVHSCEIPGCVSCANPEEGGNGE